MLCVETIGKIRRRRLVQGESISAIARDLGLAQHGQAGTAVRGRGLRVPAGSATDAEAGAVSGDSGRLAGGGGELPARERRTAQRLCEGLCLEGYTGAVDAMRRCARGFELWRRPNTTAFIPQTFASGEAYQFDWSHERVELGGVDQVANVAHVRLCHSRAFFRAACPRERCSARMRGFRNARERGGRSCWCFHRFSLTVPGCNTPRSKIRTAEHKIMSTKRVIRWSPSPDTRAAAFMSVTLACLLLQGCSRSPPPPHALQDASDSAAAASAGLKAHLPPEPAAASPEITATDANPQKP